MADEPAGDKPADTPAATADKPTDTPEVPAGAENPDAVKRALEAERKAAKEASKRAEAAEAKVREYEEANSSELEKLTNKAAKAEQARAEAEAKLVRFEVAKDKAVPAEAVDFLKGNTREELEASADKLLELVKSRNDSDKTPDFDGGPREPAPDSESPDVAHNKAVLALMGLAPPNTP